MHFSDTAVRPEIFAEVVCLVRRVGSMLAAMQHGGLLDPVAKVDGSPLTRADAAAHALLADGLADLTPYPVLSEESDPLDTARRGRPERVWIVDPLDGTRDYLRGSNAFCVNAALVEHGIPVLGVVDAPALGITYYAQRGSGAYRRAADGAPEQLRCATSLAPGARIVVSGSDAGVAWPTLPCFAGMRVDAISSAVKLGFVADGTAAAYPRLTPSSEWDIAAGHAILAEAGGRIIGRDGRELTYNKADPLNPPFLATGIAAVMAECAAILAAVHER